MRLIRTAGNPTVLLMDNKPNIPHRYRPRGLEIVYEDRNFIVVNKEAGLLTMSYHRDQNQTAERILTDYLRKGNPKATRRVFTVHRLDRDTSGLLVFAKSEKVQQTLKNNWATTEKRYFAVVQGQLKEKSGLIESYLAENKDQYIYVTKDASRGKWSKTAYTVLKETPLYTALDVKLLTGRKNQIRVHFADAGHPIVGDRKYGNKDERPGARMALHAMHLEFDNPVYGRRMVYDAPVPAEILQLVGGCEVPVSERRPKSD